ncbi:MAG TPA: C40 family peptidase [Bryobacteraceae bacterium]|nr:C40 family peptidase [Bryobacteraceae bacterium]
MPGILVAALFATALPNGVVLRPVANLYSKPSRDADVVSQAIYASNVAILEQQGDWVHVRTFDDYAGWMPGSELKAGPAYAAAGRVAEVRSMFAHLYREASVTKHEPLLTVPMETRLAVDPDSLGADEGNEWVAVRLPDHRTGYIQRGDVTFDPPKLTVPEMLEFAKRFIGLPYTWGGVSTFGYDCSGFVQMLERQRGVMMPRDAQPQADWSGQTAVGHKNLAPGDLLYFGSSAEHITHTGIYLGGGKFINATTYQTPTVHVDSLDDPHFARILVAMRRPK